MRKPVALVVVLAVAGVIAAAVALSPSPRPPVPTAVIDGWPIGAYKGICADSVCAEMTRVGLAALDDRYPTHAAVLSSTLYGLGACANSPSGHTAAPTTGAARAVEVLVVTLADGAVHAFGLGGGGPDSAPSVAPALDEPHCTTAVTGPG
jgi:hypothetical protein